jgi:hypothetical protein
VGVGVEREEEMKKLCGERGKPFCALCRFQSISKCSAQVVRLQTPPAQNPRSFQPMETRLSSPLRTSALRIHPCHPFVEEIMAFALLTASPFAFFGHYTTHCRNPYSWGVSGPYALIGRCLRTVI